MTNDEITRMAEQIWMAGESYIGPSIDSLTRFAALVAAAEREACALVCDEQGANRKALEHYAALTYLGATHDCAAALRAALAEPVQSGSCISCGNSMTGSPESFVVVTAEVGVIAPDGYSQHHVEALCSHKGGDVLSTPLSEPEREPVAWLRAIDEAMVVHDCGVVDPADDYETAKRKLNALLNTVQDIGSYFASSQQHAAQVVYQISLKNGAAASAWIDVDEAAYNSAKLHGEYKCRCLYTAPPQRKPLTDEEIKSMWGITEYREFAIDFARAIEQGHGIGDA